MKKSYRAWICAILMLSSVFVVGMQVNENAEANRSDFLRGKYVLGACDR